MYETQEKVVLIYISSIKVEMKLLEKETVHRHKKTFCQTVLSKYHRALIGL